ncbi:cadherin-7a [Stegostoma tigrinum]|uniref:cadherin-7a n=1 Tax=Stegostoma tigrinum TaxID=3053191 RepID=UPI00202AC581|nr:cadherin-7a [Stegostoma tigrinum]XP_048385226.1 cadherin-7a [Stegostoma tigrinum]XP_048385227.1 cadherin-7a [Stegostoma tigrinum]XP_048385228.1 cadherin-7a [Stegostoma tigrinum]XP_059502234.1 cadherin-7a [Stegostoma tigrinum]
MRPRDRRLCGSLVVVTVLLCLSAARPSAPSSAARGSDLTAAKPGEAHRRVKRGWVWNQFFVLEEYTGTDPLYVGKLHSDVDRGDGSVKYILSGEGAGSIFIIDESTGDIHATKRLDREEQAYYALRAQAVDRITNKPVEPLSEFIVKIQDINDNEPRFLDGPYVTSIPEMSPVGTSVIQVTATDADDPTYGSSARVVYSILQGQPYFSIEPKTGIIRTALPNMDREAKDRYLLVIQAKDMVGQMGGLSGTTSITVTLSDVNDNPPHFSRRFYQYNIPESLPVASTVAKIRALDDDIGPNAEMEYRIIDGDGLSVLKIVTDVETQEGIVTLQKELDFEKKSSYTLKIEVTNKNTDLRFQTLGPFADTTTVKLVVEDMDEAPEFNSPLYKMSVSEAASIGTAIGTVLAHDPDTANSPVRYSIDRNTDLERYFNIDATTGVITIAKSLDRETNEEHNITVLAMESQNPAQIGRGFVLISVVDVNDNSPEFPTDYETFVCENSNHGKIIQRISAVDRDKPPSGHHFYFSLAAGSANNLNFTVQDNRDNTATILTRRAGFSRQEQAVYFLPIVIVDNGTPPLSSTNTLTVRVCTCDDDGIAQSCNAEAFVLPAGLSTGALIAILACVLTLLVLVLLIVTLRRRKREPLIFDEEKDIRENIVRYDDEGGGEEDTEAFDMATLRNLNFIQDVKTRRDITPEIQLFSKATHKLSPDNIIFREFIWERMKGADTDPCAPPYDSLQTYAFEGNGSVAESLSSLDSITSVSDQNYDYLSDWGPRFKKLADMYGNSNDSMNS